MATSAIKSFLNSQPVICAGPLITDNIAEGVLKNYFSSAASWKLSTLLSATFVYELCRNKVNSPAVCLYTVYKVASFIQRWWVNQQREQEIKRLNAERKYNPLLSIQRKDSPESVSLKINQCALNNVSFQDIERFLRLINSDVFLIPVHRGQNFPPHLTVCDLTGTDKTYILGHRITHNSVAWKESYISSREYKENFTRLRDTGWMVSREHLQNLADQEALRERIRAAIIQGATASAA